jgi:drug/metabolite transporter (DMT)-like permease
LTDGHLAVVLVLASALMHATWNAIVKLSGDRLAVMAVIDSLCCCIALSLLPFVPLPHPETWPFLLASAAVAVAYKFGLLGAYRHGDFTQAYPLMRGSAPLFVALLTLAFGLDRISGGGYAGIALICCGLFILVDWRKSRPDLLLFGLAAGGALASPTQNDGTALLRNGDPHPNIVWNEIIDHEPEPL